MQEQIQGGAVAPLVALPEDHRHVAVHAVHLPGPPDAEAGFDLLEPPLVAQAGQEKAQVHVQGRQGQVREKGLEHRQVELGAVEGDQQVEVRQGRREMLQIPALDELVQRPLPS